MMNKRKVKSRLAALCRPIINHVSELFGLPSIDYLETKLQQKTQQLEQISAQQRAIYRLIGKIRASLDIEIIFRTTTKETCRLLGVERVSVYRFSEDWGGEFLGDFEFTEPGWDDFGKLGKNTVWNDSYLQEHQGGRYRYNQTFVVEDIYKAGLSQCHVEILEQFQIQAFATAPIFVKQKLWGILAAYQHSQTRQWQSSEEQFLIQVSAQLGIALQQAQEPKVEQKATDMQETRGQQKILFNLISEIRESLDFDTLFKTTAKEVRKALECDRVGLFRFDPDSNYYSGEFVAESVLLGYDSTLSRKIKDYCFAQKYIKQYQQGSIELFSDINNAGLKDCYIRMLEEFQIKAQIIVPLMLGSKLWGLLCIHQCENTREWTNKEIRFVKQLAAHFSVALEHSNLLAQTRSQADELSQALDALQEANHKLENLARVDGLTQVPNRRYFDEFLDREWRRLVREKQFLSLIILDVDHFKLYNDFYGHQVGDECLIEIAHTAQEIVKRPTDLLARYGGEEFAVILPNTDKNGASIVAAQIQSAIKNLGIPHKKVEKQIVTISLGIATQIPSIDRRPQELILEADRALYKAKQQGRDCSIHFSMIQQEPSI